MDHFIYEQIQRLLQFGLNKGLIEAYDIDYTRNSILDVLSLDEYVQVDVVDEDIESPVEILENILNWAAEHGCLEEDTVTYRDLLDTRIMGCFLSKPSEIKDAFYEKYAQIGPEAATNYLYQLSKYSHYIRTDRIDKNEQWFTPTIYGDMEITINLSKPEKDPSAIAAAKYLKESFYPQCLLCKENVGYAGRLNHPARQNLRTIPCTLHNGVWHIQFSPYSYYNEHAIVFSNDHEPMKISKKTFARLLHFVEQFPHYFIGSNADLPIVGGSILSHDHFQAGRHDFPMAKAEVETNFSTDLYKDVQIGIVHWPMSVVRLQGNDRHQLTELAEFIFKAWQNYSDETVDIVAYSGDVPHNTVTPIARKRNDVFELDLVLRNNRTSDEHPMGIFHPHQEVHHIKKENIGLIEVMGLAVLPGRLKDELKLLAEAFARENTEYEVEQNPEISKHLDWAISIKNKYENLYQENPMDILQKEVGDIFSIILEQAGVFKRTKEGHKAFVRFLTTLGFK